MKATQLLHDLGQSLWLDNITRDLLTSGTLKRYIDELSVTGLTSNPTIFDHAIKNSTAYDAAIREKLAAGQVGRGALLRAGARGPHPGRRSLPARSTTGPTAWTAGCRWRCRRCWPTTRKTTLAAAKELHARAGRPNLFIKIPGTKEGLPAIEEAIFAGVPINVTLLFSREHYVAAAEAYLRGIERRIDAGLEPDVGSVASVFISRWDVAVAGKVPAALAQPARHRHRQAHLQGVPRPARLAALAARAATPARGRSACCWASTGTKDPKASDILYVKALAAPFTVNTMPEGTLKAFADHGEVGAIMPADGGDCEAVLAAVRQGRHRRRRAGRAACRTKARSRSSSPGTS